LFSLSLSLLQALSHYSSLPFFQLFLVSLFLYLYLSVFLSLFLSLAHSFSLQHFAFTQYFSLVFRLYDAAVTAALPVQQSPSCLPPPTAASTALPH
jgi:hypothetical protein